MEQIAGLEDSSPDSRSSPDLSPLFLDSDLDLDSGSLDLDFGLDSKSSPSSPAFKFLQPPFFIS